MTRRVKPFKQGNRLFSLYKNEKREIVYTKDCNHMFDETLLDVQRQIVGMYAYPRPANTYGGLY